MSGCGIFGDGLENRKNNKGGLNIVIITVTAKKGHQSVRLEDTCHVWLVTEEGISRPVFRFGGITTQLHNIDTTLSITAIAETSVSEEDLGFRIIIS